MVGGVNQGRSRSRGRSSYRSNRSRFPEEMSRLFLMRREPSRKRKVRCPSLGPVEMGSPDYWGQIGQVVVSEENECWIQWDQPRVDPDSHWFRIDLATQEISRAELPEGFRLLAATREKLYGVILTEFEVPILTVFRLMNVGMN